MIAAASAAAPAAAGAAGILVRVPGGERLLAPEDVGAAVDRPAGTYRLRAAGTSAEPVAHPPALSVRRLVTLAGASPDTLTFVTIERPNGSLALLGRGDLTDPAPFPDGPPIVWMDAGGARYLRPLRGPDDVNGADNVGITDGDLVVRVHAGPLLVVRATADRRTVAAGAAVHLTAEVVSGAAPGPALTYAWRFGDGGSASGRAVGHAFAAAGVYEAVVTVSGSDDSGGSSAPLRIRVGAARKGAGATGGGTADRRRAPAQGPAAGSGTGGGGAPAAPATVPAPARATALPATTAPPPAAPAPATTPPRSAAQAPQRAPQARPRRRPAPAPRRAAAAGRPPAGTLVRGALVAARVAAALPGATPPGAPVAPAAARRGTDPRSDPLGPAAGIVAAIALVGVGVRRERRAPGPRREVT